MSLRIPILLYHSVSDEPAAWIAPFTVSPSVFRSHLDAIVAADATAMTVSQLVDALHAAGSWLPDRPVLVTFDDGFADFASVAHPAMTGRELCATLYVTTGYVERRKGPADEMMLGWPGLAELQAGGIELGAHSHTHPELDVLGRSRASDEINRSKALLEDHVGVEVRSFAYPHGYSSPGVRRLVRMAGFDSACAVRNAFSYPRDDVFRLARLTVRSSTTADQITAWLSGAGAPCAPRHERVSSWAWRIARRTAVRALLRAEHEL